MPTAKQCVHDALSSPLTRVRTLSLRALQVAADKREASVRVFNSSESSVVFLLSKKAGGVGLTLTGGNHLVLVDTDWNPAADAQALARIFREGQTRESYIYRLVSAYSIEEKQLQRQISKTDISKSQNTNLRIS